MGLVLHPYDNFYYLSYDVTRHNKLVCRFQTFTLARALLKSDYEEINQDVNLFP